LSSPRSFLGLQAAPAGVAKGMETIPPRPRRLLLICTVPRAPVTTPTWGLQGSSSKAAWISQGRPAGRDIGAQGLEIRRADWQHSSELWPPSPSQGQFNVSLCLGGAFHPRDGWPDPCSEVWGPAPGFGLSGARFLLHNSCSNLFCRRDTADRY